MIKSNHERRGKEKWKEIKRGMERNEMKEKE